MNRIIKKLLGYAEPLPPIIYEEESAQYVIGALNNTLRTCFMSKPVRKIVHKAISDLYKVSN